MFCLVAFFAFSPFVSLHFLSFGGLYDGTEDSRSEVLMVVLFLLLFYSSSGDCSEDKISDHWKSD